VQGIWPECAKGTDIKACVRSNSKKYVATADMWSTVKIFNYPCINKGAKFTAGKGHSSFVTNVRWSNDDKRLFTAGGEDQSIMMWQV
jgi:WD40 repeat protein